MTYGINGGNKMPAGRKPFGLDTEIIRPHKFADGQDAMGTPAANVHGATHLGYADGVTYRANLRGEPIRDNEKVQSKGMRNAAEAGFRPSDPRNGQQPAKIYGRDNPSGIHSKDVHTPGKPVTKTVGYAPDGSGKHIAASFPNRDKVVGGIHRPGTASKPSGRTISK